MRKHSEESQLVLRRVTRWDEHLWHHPVIYFNFLTLPLQALLENKSASSLQGVQVLVS